MSENIIITKKDKTANGTIQLTGSKSECNRALIIGALSDGRVKAQNVSDAADTVTLYQILNAPKKVSPTGGDLEGADIVDIGPAGTAMRFLTDYFTLQEGEETVLTCSARMKQRPIVI